ncbi:translesion error-prone DNA polymerase V autoproteolytic subunit [Croceitalea sp. MTPC9]|uniref:LexA family protein n=1 Tax=unclassified Croceitalea TaxID=2632280 RepID=UPI002B3EBCEC|nr:translesion error-prone DNA polymerase V autoproteolytic subunit [Croceitalea sp. MTPC6]GMN17661.1 translesion error-prone DNA polymerase V autoproteolytic subunit [Croceitalea sp. MTPC9]
MKPKKKIDSNKLRFFGLDRAGSSSITISNNSISAGFPSPADDFKETRISLDKTLVKNEEATFYARVSGKSMINAGLDDGDLLVIDRSLEPENGKIVVCFIDGDFTVKRLKKEKDKLFLMPENESYQPIEITEANDLLVWGVVTYVIKAL